MVGRASCLVLWALVVMMLPADAQQQPSSEPVLRVEPGMHSASIYQVTADAGGRIMATVSGDKTLRIWSLATGALVRIIRVPLGEGNVGKLYAVAMSPDGKSIVVGGWTQFQWEQSEALYVIETEGGRILRRIGGLPNVTKGLAWSADGRFVAAGLGGSNGIRIYRTSDWHEAARDIDYRDSTYGIAFDRSGRLATASDDGFVRLYDAQFRRIAKVKAPGGTEPISVAFSPDGTRLAVGFNRNVAVNVLATPGLRFLLAPEVPQATTTDDDLGIVAWTSGGALIAGGRYSDGDGVPMLRWPEGGRGKPQRLLAEADTVQSIWPLSDGGFLYATQDPALGRYDAQGARRLRQQRPIAYYNGQLDKFRLSRNGMTVGFGLDMSGGRPVSFSVEQRRLDLGGVSGDLATAVTNGLPITDFDSYKPKLAGKVLALEDHESSRSIAVSPDGQSFALGAEFSLRRYAATGTELWKLMIPDVTFAVNISRDGRLLVAAFGDGTIRWYRYRDGRELLALFMHNDGRRWVLWTPEGYYDAAPGAEDLIGWHVNRGFDHEADFFPASRFRDRFYKPEVTSAVLRTLDIDAALKEAQAKAAAPITTNSLPPVIKILSPAEGSVVSAAPVQLRYLVRSPSGEPVRSIEARLDGRPLPADQGIVKLANSPTSPQGEREGSIAVPIDHDATITLIAHSGDLQSEAANLRLVWKPPAAPPAPAVPKPKLYVLAIGVSKYNDPAIQLQYASKDAGDLAAALKRQEGGLYRQVELKLLRDGEATRSAIYDGFDWIKRAATKRDVAIVFMSGHGVRDPDDDSVYYFLPADVDLERLHATGVPQLELRASLRRISGKALFFFDTCHAGFAIDGPRGRTKGLPPDINVVVNDLVSAENGIVVFAASTGREVARERDEWQNGAFTKALTEGLTGKSDAFPDDVVTIARLEYWLAERVKTLTKGEQHPTSEKPDSIQDFPIAVVVH
jgi:WD40 repeat protein